MSAKNNRRIQPTNTPTRTDYIRYHIERARPHDGARQEDDRGYDGRVRRPRDAALRDQGRGGPRGRSRRRGRGRRRRRSRGAARSRAVERRRGDVSRLRLRTLTTRSTSMFRT